MSLSSLLTGSNLASFLVGSTATGIFQPLSRGLGNGANILMPNAFEDPATLLRLIWTHPELKDQWIFALRANGFDEVAINNFLRASYTYPSQNEILQLIALSHISEANPIPIINAQGQADEITLDELWRGAQVPVEMRQVYERLRLRVLPLESAVRMFRRFGDYDDENTLAETGQLAELPSGGVFSGAFQESKKAEGLDLFPDENIFKVFQVHPGVPDLIRFAVREVFTPSIRQQFNLDAEFPRAFAEESRKAGLSAEDAGNFWAAHWELPSFRQGTEMLHRGVINMDTLRLLLRQLDVAPFWRDKLIDISFRPLRIVDIFRMYEQRVIPRIDPDNITRETELVKQFMFRGYTFENAERLALWVDRTRPDPATEATIKTVTEQFLRGWIEESEFTKMLQELDIPEKNLDFMVAAAKTQRNQREMETALRRITPQFREGDINNAEFRQQLAAFGFSEEAINRIIEEVEAEEAQEKKGLTDAEIRRLFSKGIIKSRKEALDLLKAGGRTEKSATLLLDEIIQDRDTGVASIPLKDMLGFVQQELVSVERLRAYLKADGVPQWAITAYVNQVQPAEETVVEGEV